MFAEGVQTVRRVFTTVYERVLHPFFLCELNIYIYIIFVRVATHELCARLKMNTIHFAHTWLMKQRSTVLLLRTEYAKGTDHTSSKEY